MTRPPPPRYRVIERGRRLETIDSRTGANISRERDAAPPSRSVRGRPAAAVSDGRLTRTLVALLCRGERLPDGRYVLRTSASFDERGPREIAIGPEAMRPIAAFAGVLLLAGLAIAAAFLWLGFPAIVFAGIALGMIGQHGKGFVARLLDPLGERIEKPDRD